MNRRDASREPSDQEAGRKAVEWAVASGVAGRVRLKTGVLVRRRFRLRLGIGLGLAGVAGASILVCSRMPPRRPVAVLAPPGAELPAFAQLPSREILPDGTVAELRDGTRISVAFTPALRRVELLSGEARFQVTKNGRRPFLVVARGIQVRDIGTVFAVKLAAASVEVLVTEGRVAVARTSAPAPMSAAEVGGSPAPMALGVVPAGNRIRVELAGSRQIPRVEPVSAAEIAHELSWRIPVLHLSGTPVSEIVPLLNRYGDTHIVLGDPALASLELSGSLRADNTSTFLGILGLQFGIRAKPRGTDLVLYRP